MFDYLGDPALDAAILGAAVAAGLAAGVYPALVLAGYRPAVVLKGGPLEEAGGGRLRIALVVMQFAVLIALLFTTLTIYRQTAFALKGATHVDQDRRAAAAGLALHGRLARRGARRAGRRGRLVRLALCAQCSPTIATT